MEDKSFGHISHFGSALMNNAMSVTRNVTNRGLDRGISAMSVIGRSTIDPNILAQRWGTSVWTAEQTIKKTTQRVIRTVLNPALSRRFRTNDRQVWYRHLPINVFTDTMEASLKSTRGNQYAQVFCARNNWTRAFPMKKKADAHEGLSLLFARDGVPSTLIMDESK